MISWVNLAQERSWWRAVVNMMGNYRTRWASVVFWQLKEAGLLRWQFNLTVWNCDLCAGACGWGDNVSNSLSVGSNNSAQLTPGRKIAGLVEKPNVPCHVHKSVSLTGLCLFEKRKKSCKIRVTCWLGFIRSFPKWSTCTNTAPITWRSNVFPVLVLFTKDSKHWCFPSNGRNKMDSLQVKEWVTWWAWNVAGCRSRNVLRFAMAEAVASRWKPDTFPSFLFFSLTL